LKGCAASAPDLDGLKRSPESTSLRARQADFTQTPAAGPQHTTIAMRTTGRIDREVLLLRRSRAVYPLKFFELLAVDFGVRTEEIEVRPQRLPLALLLHFLLGKLVAFAFMDMKNVDLHVFAPARQIREHSGPLAEVTNHVTANVTAEHGAGKRILEQDFDHLFYSYLVNENCCKPWLSAAATKSTEKERTMPVLFSHLLR
jgi:hypothetical protein